MIFVSTKVYNYVLRFIDLYQDKHI